MTQLRGNEPILELNNFSINLMPGEAPVSKTPYRMSTPEMKELQMKFE